MKKLLASSFLMLSFHVFGSSATGPVSFGPLGTLLEKNDRQLPPDVVKIIESFKIDPMEELKFDGANKTDVINHIAYLVGPAFRDGKLPPHFQYVIMPIEPRASRSAHKKFHYHKKEVSVYDFINDVCEYYKLEWGVTEDGLAIVFHHTPGGR